MISRGAVRLSAAVMTHPGRLTAARALRDALPELDLRIVVDPDPGRPDSCIRNSRRAWALSEPSATHHLVLQDDVRICSSFSARLLKAVGERPDEAVSLFTEWGSYTSYAVRLSALAGMTWAPVIDPYVPAVGLVLPRASARAFSTDADLSVLQDDVALDRLLHAHDVRTSVVVPNLVEHLEGESLVGNQHMGVRHASYFDDFKAPAGDHTHEVRADDPAMDVPVFATDVLRPVAALYDGARSSWSPGSFKEFLDRQQLDASKVLEVGPAGGRAVRELLDLELSEAGQRVLGGVRCVVYALGFQAGRFGRHRELRNRRSLATVAPGALRWTMTPEALAAIGEPINVLLDDAADRGFADGVARRDRQE